MAGIRFAFVAVNGVKLHVAEAGPADGRLVLLLHGFPEYWESWRTYIDRLAAAGYHVVAPDQRGYNLSGKPAGRRAYDIDVLATDIAGLAAHFGQRRYTVIGHDWGALVAWWIATKHPDAARSACDHERAAPLRLARGDAGQSGAAAAELVRAGVSAAVAAGVAAPARGISACWRRASAGARAAARSTPEELDGYRTAWSKPGALTAMLNWYRAFLVKDLPASADCRITTPVLLIWGERDPYGVRQLADDTLALCENAQAVYFKDATHWVQHDEPERCCEALLGFLKRGPQ